MNGRNQRRSETSAEIRGPRSTFSPDAGLTPRGAGGSEVEGPQRRRLRILLAEDNPVNRMLTSAFLRRCGWEVVAAEDGEAALAAVGREVFDAVLMDVEMPGIGGLEATRIIRGRDPRDGAGRTRRMPIIGLTAHATAGDRDQCLEAGMDDYLTKPVDADALCAAVERCTGEGSQPSPPPADLSKLSQGIRGNEDLLRRLIGTFFDDYPRKVQLLHTALVAGDTSGLERTAHSLKGSLVLFDAEPAAEQTRRLEALGNEGRMEEAAGALEDLERELERLRDFLERQASQA